jgi:hypothetical protein
MWVSTRMSLSTFYTSIIFHIAQRMHTANQIENSLD